MANLTEVEREVKELTKFIKKLGTLNELNQYVVTFGILFDDEEVLSTLAAIVGTLKAAKKRKLIKFKGRYLLKGTHDNVPITLIKDMDSNATKRTRENQNIRNDLMKLSMQKLKKKCKAMKVSSEGYKSDMINRIINALKQNPQKHHHIVSSSITNNNLWNYLQDERVKKLSECVANSFVFNEQSILHSDYILIFLRKQSGIDLY